MKKDDRFLRLALAAAKEAGRIQIVHYGKSYRIDSGKNYYRMTCNVKMPAVGSINNGNYNFWVTGEDYNGYCNPGELGVDAQKYKIITLNNC